jgi:transposase-like protein
MRRVTRKKYSAEEKVRIVLEGLRGETADHEGYFVSESSVFRLLKRFDLVESPAFQLVTAADRFA